MHIGSPLLLLLAALLLPALAAPLPQEGNNQIEEFNVSPSSALPSSTAAAAAALASATTAPLDALQPPKKPKIDAQDGMSTGMGAAMAGVGQATSALTALPVLGSLAGGVGARDVGVRKHAKRLFEAVTALLGGLGGGLPGLGGGRKAKRTTVDSALYPSLKNLPNAGSAGLVNLGSNSKRDAEPGVIKALPLADSLAAKAKRQFDILKSLPGLGSLLGRKREASPEPQLDVLKGVPIVGGIINKPPKAKRMELAPLAVVADFVNIRGITSKRSPEEGDFRQELRKANKAKVDGELNKAADTAERKVKIKNTQFPPNGGKVKSPQEALDKREDPTVEKRSALDTLPVKDIAESMTGLKSALELLRSANAAMQGMNGK